MRKKTSRNRCVTNPRPSTSSWRILRKKSGDASPSKTIKKWVKAKKTCALRPLLFTTLHTRHSSSTRLYSRLPSRASWWPFGGVAHSAAISYLTNWLQYSRFLEVRKSERERPSSLRASFWVVHGVAAVVCGAGPGFPLSLDTPTPWLCLSPALPCSLRLPCVSFNF